jgi:hypothetical protein
MNPKLLDRISKLLRLARNNPNINESAAAAAAAQRLMDDNNLSEAMLSNEGQSTEPVEDVIDFGARGAPLGDGAFQRWHYTLASRLQKLHGCIVYKMAGRLQIIGKPSDVESVRYLYGYLVSEIKRLVSIHGKGMGRTWRNNYCLGAAEEVSRRLKEEHEKWRKDVRGTASDGAALMRIDRGLATLDQKQADVTAWQRQNLRLTNRRQSAINYDHMARELGRTHGANIRLGGSAGVLGAGRKQIGGGN